MNAEPQHFIENIVSEDLASGKHQSIVTRFPPEPNGFLHIGHAKSICLNFGLAEKHRGRCHLRFDDTNPEKEEQTYIEAIKSDVAWLGYQWDGDIRFASDYFAQLYELAVRLIQKGAAYVCSLQGDAVREYRGTLTTPGRNSPFRDRSIAENLQLFTEMKAGLHPEGTQALRAKIDMSSPNMNLRDPVLYRIRFAHHHQTGDQWCIYPMYDFTHALSDAFEAITHSLCTVEFEAHRPLYEWCIAQFDDLPSQPRQIEFSRLNLNYTVTSKRKLKKLVDQAHVNGWDDPRMPTISGLRRRGYTAHAIRRFCEAVGVTKAEGVVDMGMLEFAIRDDLDKSAPRAMCVLRPLKVILTGVADDFQESLTAPCHPKADLGTRTLLFTKELYIDRADFSENPPPKYFRLAPGKEVRLRNSYVIRCDDVIKDDRGEVIALHCSFDRQTLGKKPEGRKVKGVIHWVSAATALPCEIRLYDRLFSVENPDAAAAADEQAEFTHYLNPNSLEVIEGAMAEPSLQEAEIGAQFQFEREGYFTLDPDASKANATGNDAMNRLVFNRTVTLKDSWEKITKKQA